MGDPVTKLPRCWDGTLNANNAEAVAARIREQFEGKTFTIASANYAGKGEETDIEVRTDCHFNSDWTDGSPEQIRVFTEESGRVWIGFSAGHHFWPLHAAPGDGYEYPVDRYTHIHLDWNKDQMTLTWKAPAGGLFKHCFAVQRNPEWD